MSKKTWKFRGLVGQATDALATGASVSAVARQLSVDRSTLHRWIKSGRVAASQGRQTRLVVRQPASVQTPEGWADAVRAAYELSATELELVVLADAARAMANDSALRPADRLSAMAKFAALTKQLNLEVVSDGAIETTVRPFPRRVI